MSDMSNLADVLTGPNDPITMLKNWTFGDGLPGAQTAGAGSVSGALMQGLGLGG